MSSKENAFAFPIGKLENSRIRLVQFNLDEHGPAFVEGTRDHPQLFDYMTIGPYQTLDDLNGFLKSRVFSSDLAIAFAIMIKPSSSTGSETFAGMIGYLNSNPTNLFTEIGFITILPKFQGTFVTRNATGLLLMYGLEPPPLGLGLRRIDWQCHAGNEASKRFARKMLFTYEGTRRFDRVMPLDKPGNGYELTDPSGKKIRQSRDTELYGHYCDEWTEKRTAIIEIMDRA